MLPRLPAVDPTIGGLKQQEMAWKVGCRDFLNGIFGFIFWVDILGSHIWCRYVDYCVLETRFGVNGVK